MERYEAVFEIDSKTDAYAARRMLERVYDTVREESKQVREGGEGAAELLEDFRRLREETAEVRPGRLTLTYETADDGFED